MCKKTNYKTSNPRIDKCMKRFMDNLQTTFKNTNYKIIACCCGHRKYPMTIVIRSDWVALPSAIYDLVSGIEIKRKRKFYKRDDQGYYYIPETTEAN